MPHYKSLGEVKAHFRNLSDANSRYAQEGVVVLNASLADPKDGRNEGVSAEVTGTHLYLRLELAVGFTTTGDNEQRKRLIRIQGKFVQGFHEILSQVGGEVLEAQGEMVHGFVPSENGDTSDANETMHRMMAFVGDVIQPKAGDDYRKCTGSFCYGQTIFVSAPGSHKDLSIVSLSNAANAPAKVLYLKAESLSEKQIVEVKLDGGYRPSALLTEKREFEINSEVKAMSATLPPIGDARISAANRASPLVGSADQIAYSKPSGDPENPTIDDPRPVFAICFRADIDGFTKMVAAGFQGTPTQRQELANLFYTVMSCCRDFCNQLDLEVVQMPWAGDSFNLLLVAKEVTAYQTLREEEILRVSASFEDFLKSQFPDLTWSFSSAGGNIDSRQICNALVSRIRLPSESDLKSHMLTAGLPIQRALEGRIQSISSIWWMK